MTRKRFGRKYVRSALFIGISTLIVLVGGSVTLLWQIHQGQVSRADGSNIVGPPSLPAATVDSILARMGSPMVGTGKVIEQASRQTNIDDAFALGVWWTETNDGAAGVGSADRNPGSVRGSPGYPSAFDGYTIYPSYAAAVVDWFTILRSRYVNRGLTSVYTICYPYVGTSSAPLWAGKVVNLMTRYRGEAPPPTPTAAPATPTPTRPPLSTRNHPSYHPNVQSVPVPPAATSPAQPPKQIAAPQPLAHGRQAASPLGKTLPVGLCLLSALAIGLWGLKVRRSVPVVRPALSSWQPAPAYPPLYVNQYSPVLEQQPSPILFQFAERKTDQLAFSQTGQFAFAEVDQLSFPGVTSWSPLFAQQPAEPAASGTGLLSRYQSSMDGITVGALPLSNSIAEQPTGSLEAVETPRTDALPPLPMVNLPGRKPALVGARSAGLLRRYASEH